MGVRSSPQCVNSREGCHASIAPLVFNISKYTFNLDETVHFSSSKPIEDDTVFRSSGVRSGRNVTQESDNGTSANAIHRPKLGSDATASSASVDREMAGSSTNCPSNSHFSILLNTSFVVTILIPLVPCVRLQYYIRNIISRGAIDTTGSRRRGNLGLERTV